jgi:site-specific DNA recombinase
VSVTQQFNTTTSMGRLTLNMLLSLASTVRLIFRRYAELSSVSLLSAELNLLGIMSKCREGAGGRLAGGQHFSRGALYLMLQNRLYRGDIVHQREAYPGQHEAIIDPELWQIVQDTLAAKANAWCVMNSPPGLPRPCAADP